MQCLPLSWVELPEAGAGAQVLLREHSQGKAVGEADRAEGAKFTAV